MLMGKSFSARNEFLAKFYMKLIGDDPPLKKTVPTYGIRHVMFSGVKIELSCI